MARRDTADAVDIVGPIVAIMAGLTIIGIGVFIFLCKLLYDGLGIVARAVERRLSSSPPPPVSRHPRSRASGTVRRGP